jgi:hypothetical protein
MLLNFLFVKKKKKIFLLNFAIHRHNEGVVTSLLKDKTPYEAWSNLKPEVTHFRIFGSHAWARIPSEKRKEIDPHIT